MHSKMFWLDGSSKLPFPIVSTRFIGKPCVEHLAEDLASIENQAKIAKSWVEIGDFDRWCHAASELVDLTYYLIYADTTFLYYEELISADERLRRCSQLKSQLVDSVRFSTFELARTRLVANLKFATPSAPTTISTISLHRDESVIQRSSSDSTETSARVTTLSPALPRHTALNRITTSPHAAPTSPTPTTINTPRDATLTGVASPPPHRQPVSVGITNPPQPPTSHEVERRVNDPLGLCTKEGDGEEGVGSRKRRGEVEKGGGEEEVEAAAKQEPGRHPPPPPPTNDARTQENGTSRRWRRRQCRRPHSCCCNATAPVTVLAPKRAPNPAFQHAPPTPTIVSDDAHIQARPKRRRRHRRRHPDGASNAPSPRTTANSVGKPDRDTRDRYQRRRRHRRPSRPCTTLEHPPPPTPAPFPIPTPTPIPARTPSTPAKVNSHVIQNHVTYNRFFSCCCDSNAGSLSTRFFLHGYICGLMLPFCIFTPGISLNKLS